MLPLSSKALSQARSQRADVTRLMANALAFFVRVEPCPDDCKGDARSTAPTS